MPASVCPHCGTKLPPFADAFCGECRNRLDEPPPGSFPGDGPTTAGGKTRLPLPVLFGFLGGLAGAVSGLLHLLKLAGSDRGLVGGAGYIIGSAIVLGLVGLLLGVVVELVLSALRSRPKE